MRIISIFGYGASYIRDFTVVITTSHCTLHFNPLLFYVWHNLIVHPGSPRLKWFSRIVERNNGNDILTVSVLNMKQYLARFTCLAYYQPHPATSLQWRHNECDGLSNHRRFDCLFHAQIKENIKAPRHKPLWGEFTGDRPTRRASNAKNVSIWWRHHMDILFGFYKLKIQQIGICAHCYTQRIHLTNYAFSRNSISVGIFHGCDSIPGRRRTTANENLIRIWIAIKPFLR